ncbi:hypothetical protein PENSPDRAFT_582933 [Peniophora sp. CONT]|nr:hypothetical protein PENSPDRAFT_582933 [Peniophora sp. CONT]
MSSVSTRTIDHIVIRAPDGGLSRATEEFERLGFRVIPGGKHTDGLTANILIILSDLSYIEIIAFEHPAEYYKEGTPEYIARISHQWANKPAGGLVAYSFAGAPSATPSLAQIINGRLENTGSTYRYQDPVEGGRTRPDGVEMRWVLVKPTAWEKQVDGMGRPFFCGDITAREIRVPTEKKLHEHSNKATSVAFLRVLVSSSSFAEKSSQLDAILGAQHTTGPISEWHEWELSSVAGSAAPRLILTIPDEGDQKELDFVERYGMGVWGIGFRYERQAQQAEVQSIDALPYISFVPAA